MDDMTTTQHTTTHHMDTYTLGHHLTVAGREYLKNAQDIVREGSPLWLARTMLEQGEQALLWAQALENAEEVRADLNECQGTLYVQAEDASDWVREQVASVRSMVDEASLPSSPSPVVSGMDSPTGRDDVSRETLETPPPASQPLWTIVEDMDNDTITQPQPTLTDLVASLIAGIAKEVLTTVRAEMEEVAESAVESALDSHDFADEVTDSYQFTQAVEDAVSEAIGNLTFTVTVD